MLGRVYAHLAGNVTHSATAQDAGDLIGVDGQVFARAYPRRNHVVQRINKTPFMMERTATHTP